MAKTLCKRKSKKTAIGMKMSDGTVFAGVSPETGKPMYAAAEDARLSLSFNKAAKYAKTLRAHGHSDWRVPTRKELTVLHKHSKEGKLKGTFKEAGLQAGYWSSTTHHHYTDSAWVRQFGDVRRQGSLVKDAPRSVRCVRG